MAAPLAYPQPQTSGVPLDPLYTNPPTLSPPLTPATTPSRWSSWFKWPMFKLNLPNPGKYEDFSKEAQEITTTQEYFDGMKFDFGRIPSENFVCVHTIQMGSADVNGGGTYTFAPTVISQNKKTTLIGRFDGDGRVFGRAIHALTPRITLMGHTQITEEQSVLAGEATYAGDNYTVTAKLEAPSVVEVTMMQSVLPTVGVGMQFLHFPQPHGAMTGMSMVLRAFSGTEVVKPLTQQRVPRWVFAANSGSLTPLHATFTWHTPAKADFATEFALTPRQDGTLDSVWCAGALFEFNSGRIKTRVDSRMRMGIFIEEAISPTARAYLCGDLDHLQNKYKVGVGISIQS